MNEDLNGEMRLSSKLAVLSGMLSISQVEMAQKCGLSRITINRFFRGRTQIKSEDLRDVLGVLGINLEEMIERRIGDLLEGTPPAHEASVRGQNAGATQRIQHYLQGVEA